MYTAVAWRDETAFDLGALATPRPDPLPDDFEAGEDQLSLARLAFTAMTTLFGSARDVMLAMTLLRRDWFDLQCWLQHLEKLTRRGLMMLALNIARRPGAANAPTPPAPPAFTGEAAAREEIYEPRPAKSFVVMRRVRAGGGCAGEGQPLLRTAYKPTLNLARRMDALLRVLNAPEAYARRFALKLERLVHHHTMGRVRAPRDEHDKTGKGAPPRAVLNRLYDTLKPLERRVALYFQPP